jgi:hypothetical protein
MVRTLDRSDLDHGAPVSLVKCHPVDTLPSITYHLEISRKYSQRHPKRFALDMKEQEHAIISENIVARYHFTLTIDAVGHTFFVYLVRRRYSRMTS